MEQNICRWNVHDSASMMAKHEEGQFSKPAIVRNIEPYMGLRTASSLKN